MALVDLKSKLNQFRGGNSSVNPYEKGRSVETKLESNTDINTNPDREKLSDTVDGKGRQILGQTISTQASTFLKGIKQFGIKFTKGDETFNIKDPNWGIGSYWYDPIQFMKDQNHQHKNISILI